MEKNKALIIVDLQYDFLPGGALAVPESNEITSTIIDLVTSGDYQYIITSQDWHPKKHGSFASAHNAEPFTMGELDGQPQMLWPDHCIRNTQGAKIFEPLDTWLRTWLDKKASIGVSRRPCSCVKDNPWMQSLVGVDNSGIKRIGNIRKGQNKKVDSYSVFYDNNKKNKTNLTKWLLDFFADRVDVCGLATDYCVKHTALDSVGEGFKTRVLLPACRGVTEETTQTAIQEMKDAGVEIVECLAFEE